MTSVSKNTVFRMIDIGANLMAERYHIGIDIDSVLERSWKYGLEKIIITSGRLRETKDAITFIEKERQKNRKTNEIDGNNYYRLYSTVGVHPTRAKEFESEGELYFQQLLDIAKLHSINNGGKYICAIGECGLDYERFQFCDKNTQLKHFEKHFELCEASNYLPIFLHNRRSTKDLIQLLSKNRHRWKTAVVHSFTDTAEDMKEFLKFDGMYIGINGCSLKTNENLEMIRSIPNERLLIETDCPFCGIKKSFSGYSYLLKTHFKNEIKKYKKTEDYSQIRKGRTEPCHIIQVLEVIAGIKGENIDSLSEIIFENTVKLFFSQNYNHMQNSENPRSCIERTLKQNKINNDDNEARVYKSWQQWLYLHSQ